MSRIKQIAFYVSALLLFAGIVVPAQGAPVVQVAIAGSSAMWQNSALAAWNLCGATCFHYTKKSGNGFNLNDQRVPGGNLDGAQVWFVWDSNTAPTKVWAYYQVDSVVGDRCYFARPSCQMEAPAPNFPAADNLIPLAIWGGGVADQVPPATVQALFQTPFNTLVNVAATDIRPEDALAAICRANATLDPNDPPLKGLGYNTHNAYNGDPTLVDIFCPANVTTVQTSYPTLVGNPVKSAVSTATANVIAFNIQGTDPFPPNNAIPSFTVVPVGASPITFVTRRKTALATLKAATDPELQCVYTLNGGPKQNASCFGLAANNIDVYQREPLSGTMNTTEFSVFRNNAPFLAYSQEDDVNPNVAGGNPLNQGTGVGVNCGTAGDQAGRFRVIGTGEMINQIFASTAAAGGATVTADPACDAVGYAFFSFGNVLKISASPNYGYLTLDGLDPIGIPTLVATQQLPSGNALPAGCAALPCTEFKIWAGTPGNLSFPSLRAAGTLASPFSKNDYRAWSVLRFVADSTNAVVLGNAKALATGAQTAAACTVPDFVPYSPVPATACGTADPGLVLLRSHYDLKYSTGGAETDVSPNNGDCNQANEKGRDEGGCVIRRNPLATCGLTDAVIDLAQEYANPTLGQCTAPSFPTN